MRRLLPILSLLILLSPLSLAQLRIPPNAKLPLLEAQKLIRELNLSPKDCADPVDDEVAVAGIMEKRFDFANLAGDEESGVTVEDLGHFTGYYKIEHSRAARMFYFFFESRSNKKDPVVIWLTGGPGCSSELAMFYENGPFNIANNLSLQWNPYGWDKASNLLYVDQPIGTGFSYSSDKKDIRHNEAGVSNDLYDFLQAFFKEHPQFQKNDFYITGESYAGHYIPAFAARVHQGNKAKEGIHINLKGFAIGNVLTDPAIQYKAYTDYALDMGIIKKADYNRINKYYDLRKKCVGSLCYDFSNMEKFLNQKNVRESLGVGDIDFVSCSPTVYQAMLVDWMRNLEAGIPALLEDGIDVLIYAGEYDLICNWLGNSRWVHAMEWSGQKKFVESEEEAFEVDGSVAGVLKSHGRLTFLKVHDAGHIVPMDQPKAALEMLRRWTGGSLSSTVIAESDNDMVSSI